MVLGTGKWPIPFSFTPSNASHAIFARSSILCFELTFFAVVFIISYYMGEFASGLSEVISWVLIGYPNGQDGTPLKLGIFHVGPARESSFYGLKYILY